MTFNFYFADYRLSTTFPASVFALALIATPAVAAAGSQDNDDPLSQHSLYLAAAMEGHCALGTDNIRAEIVWMRSFCIDSLIDAFLASGDTDYLDLFQLHAKDIFSLRNDLRDNAASIAPQSEGVGSADFGSTAPGWSVAYHYSLSYPLTLLDEVGEPVLQVRGIARSANNATSIAVVNHGSTVSIHMRNDWSRSSPVAATIEGLTAETIEERINTHDIAGRYIEASSVGDALPAASSPQYLEPIPFVFHTHHSGTILVPFLRLAALHANGAIPEDYADDAAIYVERARETMADYESEWEDHGDFGFYRMKRDIPFWVDGAPEPINVMSEHGLAFLYLWEATGDLAALERVRQIIGLIKRNARLTDDNAMYWPYWHSDALTGWTAEDDISSNTPDFEPYPWLDTTHYAQPTVRFLAEAHRVGAGVSDGEMAQLVNQFWTVWQGSTPDDVLDDGYLLHAIDGSGQAKGRDDVDIYGYILLSRHDPEVLRAVRRIYQTSFLYPDGLETPHRNGRALAVRGWAALASALADEGAGNP